MASAILTPLVTRLLRKYIRSSSEGHGRELKASWSSKGTLVLHDLELDLQQLLPSCGVEVRRAYAARLEVSLPWKGLRSQPVEITLTGVRLELVPGGGASDRDVSPPPPEPSSGPGWFAGALTSVLLRAGLSARVALSDVRAAWAAPGDGALRLGAASLELCTPLDGWAEAAPSDAWLKKSFSVRGLEAWAGDGADEAASWLWGSGAAPARSWGGGAGEPRGPEGGAVPGSPGVLEGTGATSGDLAGESRGEADEADEDGLASPSTPGRPPRGRRRRHRHPPSHGRHEASRPEGAAAPPLSLGSLELLVLAPIIGIAEGTWGDVRPEVSLDLEVQGLRCGVTADAARALRLAAAAFASAGPSEAEAEAGAEAGRTAAARPPSRASVDGEPGGGPASPPAPPSTLARLLPRGVELLFSVSVGEASCALEVPGARGEPAAAGLSPSGSAVDRTPPPVRGLSEASPWPAEPLRSPALFPPPEPSPPQRGPPGALGCATPSPSRRDVVVPLTRGPRADRAGPPAEGGRPPGREPTDPRAPPPTLAPLDGAPPLPSAHGRDAGGAGAASLPTSPGRPTAPGAASATTDRASAPPSSPGDGDGQRHSHDGRSRSRDPRARLASPTHPGSHPALRLRRPRSLEPPGRNPPETRWLGRAQVTELRLEGRAGLSLATGGPVLRPAWVSASLGGASVLRRVAVGGFERWAEAARVAPLGGSPPAEGAGDGGAEVGVGGGDPPAEDGAALVQWSCARPPEDDTPAIPAHISARVGELWAAWSEDLGGWADAARAALGAGAAGDGAPPSGGSQGAEPPRTAGEAPSAGGKGSAPPATPPTIEASLGLAHLILLGRAGTAPRPASSMRASPAERGRVPPSLTGGPDVAALSGGAVALILSGASASGSEGAPLFARATLRLGVAPAWRAPRDAAAPAALPPLAPLGGLGAELEGEVRRDLGWATLALRDRLQVELRGAPLRSALAAFGLPTPPGEGLSSLAFSLAGVEVSAGPPGGVGTSDGSGPDPEAREPAPGGPAWRAVAAESSLTASFRGPGAAPAGEAEGALQLTLSVVAASAAWPPGAVSTPGLAPDASGPRAAPLPSAPPPPSVLYSASSLKLASGRSELAELEAPRYAADARGGAAASGARLRARLSAADLLTALLAAKALGLAGGGPAPSPPPEAPAGSPGVGAGAGPPALSTTSEDAWDAFEASLPELSLELRAADGRPPVALRARSLALSRPAPGEISARVGSLALELASGPAPCVILSAPARALEYRSSVLDGWRAAAGELDARVEPRALAEAAAVCRAVGEAVAASDLPPSAPEPPPARGSRGLVTLSRVGLELAADGSSAVASLAGASVSLAYRRAASGRPWLAGPGAELAAALSAEGEVLGLALSVRDEALEASPWGGGAGERGAALPPVDLRAGAEAAWGPGLAPSLSLAFEGGEVALRLTPGDAGALGALAEGLARALASPDAGGGPAAAAIAAPPAHGQALPPPPAPAADDDLASALFSLDEGEGELAPLGVRAETPPGAGAGAARWRYPFARRVAVVAVPPRLGPWVLSSRARAGEGPFAGVPTLLLRGSDSDVLRVPARASTRAEEWRLEWRGAGAEAVLASLRVNPPGAEARAGAGGRPPSPAQGGAALGGAGPPLPPRPREPADAALPLAPLPRALGARRSASLRLGALRLAAADDRSAAPRAQLVLSGLHAAAHAWDGGARAASASCRLSAALADTAAGRDRIVLAPSDVAVAAEDGGGAGPRPPEHAFDSDDDDHLDFRAGPGTRPSSASATPPSPATPAATSAGLRVADARHEGATPAATAPRPAPCLSDLAPLLRASRDATWRRLEVGGLATLRARLRPQRGLRVALGAGHLRAHAWPSTCGDLDRLVAWAAGAFAARGPHGGTEQARDPDGPPTAAAVVNRTDEPLLVRAEGSERVPVQLAPGALVLVDTARDPGSRPAAVRVALPPAEGLQQAWSAAVALDGLGPLTLSLPSSDGETLAVVRVTRGRRSTPGGHAARPTLELVPACVVRNARPVPAAIRVEALVEEARRDAPGAASAGWSIFSTPASAPGTALASRASEHRLPPGGSLGLPVRALGARAVVRAWLGDRWSAPLPLRPAADGEGPGRFSGVLRADAEGDGSVPSTPPTGLDLVLAALEPAGRDGAVEVTLHAACVLESGLSEPVEVSGATLAPGASATLLAPAAGGVVASIGAVELALPELIRGAGGRSEAGPPAARGGRDPSAARPRLTAAHPGGAVPVSIPRGAAEPLDAWLVTREHASGDPRVRLSLRPCALVENATPFPASVRAAGASPAPPSGLAPPLSATHPRLPAAHSIVVQLEAPSGAIFRTGPIPVDDLAVGAAAAPQPRPVTAHRVAEADPGPAPPAEAASLWPFRAAPTAAAAAARPAAPPFLPLAVEATKEALPCEPRADGSTPATLRVRVALADYVSNASDRAAWVRLPEGAEPLLGAELGPRLCGGASGGADAWPGGDPAAPYLAAPPGAAAARAAEPPFPARAFALAPGETRALAVAWPERRPAPRDRARRRPSWGSGGILRTLTRGALASGVVPDPGPPRPAVSGSPGPGACEVGGDLRFSWVAGDPAPLAAPPDPADVGLWSSRVSPHERSKRTRLRLGPGSPSPSSAPLSTRAVSTRGGTHVVLFLDAQPPLAVENRLASVLRVEAFATREETEAARAGPAPGTAAAVPSGGECELRLPRRAEPASAEAGARGGDPAVALPNAIASNADAWADSEDEDAFLSSLQPAEAPDSSVPSPPPPPSLPRTATGGAPPPPPGGASRAPYAVVWADGPTPAIATVPLVPGSAVDLGPLGRLLISRRCATLRLRAVPAGRDDPEGEGDLAATGQGTPAPAPWATFWVDLEVLQLSLWDDERGGLRARAGAGSSRRPALAPLAPSHPPPRAARPAEVATAHVCGAVLCLRARPGPGGDSGAAAPTPGGGAPAARRLSGAASVGLLQLDVHVARGGQGGVAFVAPSPGEGAHTRAAILRLAAVDEDGGRGPLRFRSWWVEALDARLAPAALAVDDQTISLLSAAPSVVLADRPGSSSRAGRGEPEAGPTDPRERSALGDPTRATNGALATAEPALQTPAAPEATALPPRPSPPPGDPASPAPPPVLAKRAAELRAEAAGASASRLYIARASIASIVATLDVHVSAEATGLPVGLDADAAPLRLSELKFRDALFRPHVLARGVAAHAVAEALLGAPAAVGSLALLFNPTGLVRSLARGVSDLFELPLRGLANGSAAGFLAGVGAGSASLVSNLAGWSLDAVSGFSYSVARAVGQGTGIGGAYGGDAGDDGDPGLPSRPKPPSAAVLGAVGAPVRAAFNLLGHMASGIADGAGLSARPRPRRPAAREEPRLEDGDRPGGSAPASRAASRGGSGTSAPPSRAGSRARLPSEPSGPPPSRAPSPAGEGTRALP